MKTANLVPIRMLNEAGLAAFGDYFLQTPETGRFRSAAPPAHLLFDDAYSEAIPACGLVATDLPVTKQDIASGVDTALGFRFRELVDRAGVCEWLLLLWADAFLTRKESANGVSWELNEGAKYVVDRRDVKKSFRHHVWGPAMLYHSYGQLARSLLLADAKPFHDALDVFVWSGAAVTSLMKAVDLLYVKSDGTMVEGANAVRRKDKGGIAEARAGGMADAYEVLWQFARTHSIHRISPERLVEMLPAAEFGKFKANARRRILDGVPAPDRPFDAAAAAPVAA